MEICSWEQLGIMMQLQAFLTQSCDPVFWTKRFLSPQSILVINVVTYNLQRCSWDGVELQSLKDSQLSLKLYAKGFIPIGSHPVIHLMMPVGLKFVFKHLPRPLYLHICTSFSFRLSRGRGKILWIAQTKADITSGWMLKNMYKLSTRLSLLFIMIWGQFEENVA